MGKILYYWNTLKYLKPIQYFARIKFILFKCCISRVGLIKKPPQVRLCDSLWQTPIPRAVSQVGPNTFRFLNKEHHLLREEGWKVETDEKLWLYNLHYFTDLNAENALTRIIWHQSLLADWIAKNPVGVGVGWDPYPTSLRIVNWIKWALSGRGVLGFSIPNDFNQSLAVQARWLMKRLEWHLLGNHLFANAKALVFSGLYFEGKEANIWLEKGLKIIGSQLNEQVLNDGGNFERSTMYHAMFLEDLLDLINIACAFSRKVDPKLVDYWRMRAKKMLTWLNMMCHPDGEIALFNDAAFGVAPIAADLTSYAYHLGIKSDTQQKFDCNDQKQCNIQHLKDSGYIRLTSKDSVMLLDVAAIGPDYLPGHAHADTLSFEMSLFDERIIVNGGTSRYGLGPERLQERHTKSHSTVEINGQSSSEVWGGFRVARRAYPFDLDIFFDSSRAIVSCSHDGYKRLPGKPIHRRTWEMSFNSIEVKDRITGSYSEAIARFIIHPNITVLEVTKYAYQLKLPQGNLINFLVNEGLPSLECASYSPEFGKTFPTNCISVKLYQDSSSIQMNWT